MTDRLQHLLSILDLEKIDQNLFRGQSGNSRWQRVFGGHVIAQALVAAHRSVAPDRFIHSLHAYFIRPGDPDRPIIYEVEPLRDGRSFSVRRVVAKQNGVAILSFSSSFQVDEPGLDYQRPMPKNLPQPETLSGEHAIDQAILESAPENIRNYWNEQRPFLIRPIDLEDYLTRDKHQPVQRCWFKLNGKVASTRSLNSALLAYLSDMTLLDTSLIVHGLSIFTPGLIPASLDHSMWFHRPFSLDDWMLYDIESPNTHGARGLSEGYIYTRDGKLIASVAQEGLIRLVEPKS
ncbi:acyl-CoA thioesterase II [Bartonella sp. B10834G6]|uniref:Acyl-CoA thioesterase 2 n=2 Tax=Bartonella apis TaxID=1686310 RepID=A0A1R0FBG0_9HYPH|nr:MULTISPECIES: acyl-CoA thioesterase II [Bartonella]MBH9981317.1 acyl-CoA thioesterase II [Bartonella apis]MBI0170354.1 acyl-CoA thioesterase II [Bartonella sp. W8167]MBI0175668.1 acyl-CoA thioesterase II [Bartonella apis]OLY44239.1 acyl-CoA thioesterase-2 [Bartonella apis]OLY46768.1 acyl-CoA thioesterase-2 [Bartonella apis]